MEYFSLLFRLSGIDIAKSKGYETVVQFFWLGQRLHLELDHSLQRHFIGVLGIRVFSDMILGLSTKVLSVRH